MNAPTGRSAAALLPFLLSVPLWLGACQPTVRVEPPKEPIVVNLNVKIEHEVRVRVDKDVEELIADNPDLF